MEEGEPHGQARPLKRARESSPKDNGPPDEQPRHVDKKQLTSIPNCFNALDSNLLTLIYSTLPDLRSLAHLAMSCRHMRTALRDNESSIARNLAARLIDDDIPEGVKLAFIIVKAHSIDTRSPQAVRQFCETYVNRYNKEEHNEPRKDLYNLRALPTIRRIFDAAREISEWVWSAIDWPLVATSIQMSRSEEARLRRYIYIGEIGFTLLHQHSYGPPYEYIDRKSDLRRIFRDDELPATKLIELSSNF